MADIETKKITELDENEEVVDSDQLIVGNAGTAAIKRIKISNFITSLIKKIGLKDHARADLVQNASTDDSTKAVSAAVAKGLQDQITLNNPRTRTIILNSTLAPGSDSITDFTYYSVPGLSDWMEIEVYAGVGNVLYAPYRIHKGTDGGTLKLSAYYSVNYNGSGDIHIDWVNNRVGLRKRGGAGWTYAQIIRVFAIYGVMK